MGSPTLATIGESQIMSGLATLVGQAAADQFRTDVRATYITQSDLQEIAGLGFNSVRVPVPYTLLEDDSAPYEYKAAGWQMLDNIVSWAQQAGIYVIFDLHAAPGGPKPSAATATQGMADYLQSIPSAAQDPRMVAILQGTGS